MKCTLRPDGSLEIPLDQIDDMSPEEKDDFIETLAEIEIQATEARLKAEKEKSAIH